ncbi:MAG TPA: trypsin-like peptidase domain-containing protein [Candidatus Saccharimonadales bacterium]|nr:trypsin-like peptidase domain-containing protein [Candidatus Saccharimonadales bacterium]
MTEQPHQPRSFRNLLRTLWPKAAPVVISLAAGFVGAWLLLATGIVKSEAAQTLTDSRQTLVLQQGEIVSDVFKKVSPSTVAITTESISTSQRYLAPRVSEGAGSGIIVSKDGYVLTNKHVVPNGTSKVSVVTSDGTQYDNVRLVGRDPSNDIAFLKIDGATDLPAATIGDSSQVEPGQQVVAIGNALGLFRNSVTSGIISGLGRPIQAADESTGMAEQLEDMLQTDAAINPGNSGGPLVNLKGEVIGINTAVSQDGQGISFAIPINTARGLIKSVLNKGKIEKAFLGVANLTINADVAKQLNLSVKAGALVRASSRQPAIIAGSPAAKAGIKAGDIITKVNGQAITPESGLPSKLAQFSPGDTVELTLVRDGQEQKISVTLESYPQ